jgi:NADH:ubiquinone oxidoreductase subunit F (NADH-binding)
VRLCCIPGVRGEFVNERLAVMHAIDKAYKAGFLGTTTLAFPFVLLSLIKTSK